MARCAERRRRASRNGSSGRIAEIGPGPRGAGSGRGASARRAQEENEKGIALASLHPRHPRSAACPFCPPDLLKRAHTYSIVAYDSATGDLGIAVQSKFPHVGGLVPWAKAG